MGGASFHLRIAYLNRLPIDAVGRIGLEVSVGLTLDDLNSVQVPSRLEAFTFRKWQKTVTEV